MAAALASREHSRALHAARAAAWSALLVVALASGHTAVGDADANTDTDGGSGGSGGSGAATADAALPGGSGEELADLGGPATTTGWGGPACEDLYEGLRCCTEAAIDAETQRPAGCDAATGVALSPCFALDGVVCSGKVRPHRGPRPRGASRHPPFV